MDEGLFRKELEAVTNRYGYLIWRRCQSKAVDSAAGERFFREALSKIAATGSELRGRDDKLAWIYATVDRVAGAPTAASDADFEAWHAGDPNPTARDRVKQDPEAQALVEELTKAKATFGSKLDVKAAIDELFRDEPLPPVRDPRIRGLLALFFVAGGLLALLLWPSSRPPVFVPERFELSLLIQRDGAEERFSGPEAFLRGSDRVLVELSVPTQRTATVLVLENDGSLTELATGRLFHPGVHVLPQTLHVDDKRPLRARLVAGPPGLVRTATTTGKFEGVLSVVFRPEASKPTP